MYTNFAEAQSVEPITQISDWDAFEIYGPSLIGALLSTLVLGIVWAAISGYFYRYPKDRTGTKILVLALGCLTTAESVVICLSVIKTSAVHAGDIPYAIAVQFTHIGWLRIIFGSLAGYITQLFMIRKIMSLYKALSWSKNSKTTKVVYWAAYFILVGLATLSISGCLANPIYLSTLEDPYSLAVPGSRQYRVSSWLWISTFICLLTLDVILNIMFSIRLRTARTGFAMSNRIIDTLIVVLLRNGFLVTALQVATLILYKLGKSAIWIAFPSALISKIYVLTVISILTRPRDTQQSFTNGVLERQPQPRLTAESDCSRCRSCQSCKMLQSCASASGPPDTPQPLLFKNGQTEFCRPHERWESRKGDEKIEVDIHEMLRGDFPGNCGQGESLGRYQGHIVIRVDEEKDVFISPSDLSSQANRQPRSNRAQQAELDEPFV
ncbi:uncharacterized protein I303_101238 [Kwoniella dejecticola CBS 10117]|uniref:Uncharacterized protein n=1 Tax=Kwoniella dejecticola CBS 10117 TaxID=1296121 RepID=A0A1A6AHC7_9TREE|nr:uncharacterized protein I303_01245 [Kwoniella dejecticola CBS 10117]OBR89418.1 hypothetical protein I303_01245 [Kwoniella dejecticola CBS 10117]